MSDIGTLAQIQSNYAGATPSTGKEVEEAFNDNFDAVKTAVNSKVDKIDGKGLSTNDYTDSEKEQLANLSGSITDVYLKSETDVLLAEKADKDAIDQMNTALYGVPIFGEPDDDDSDDAAEPVYEEVVHRVHSSNISVNKSYKFAYEVQTAFQGKFIHSIRGDISAGTFTVWMANDVHGNDIFWSLQIASPGNVAELVVDHQLPLGKYLGFSAEGDTYSSWWVYSGGGNPVGGGAYFNGSLNSNIDLNVAITIRVDEEGEAALPDDAGDIPRLWAEVDALKNGGVTGEQTDYIALGDSITIGMGVGAEAAYPARLSLRAGVSLTANYGVSGTSVMGGTGFILQVNQVPAGFTGLVTLMIGTNNYSNTIGDVPTVLAKAYDELSLTASVAEAFRYCLESLLRTAPDAKVLVILPIKSADRETANMLLLRQAERDICEYFAVPYSELHKTCGISPLTFDTLMQDGLHPTAMGHYRIAEALWPDVKRLIE